MIITLRKLGPINEATIDLTKKLTILCGPNATGKTYAAYIVYHILHNFSTRVLKRFDKIDKIEEETVFDITNDDIKLWCENLKQDIITSLPQIFGISASESIRLFKDFSIDINLGNDPLSTFRKYKSGGSIAIGSHKIVKWSTISGSAAINIVPADDIDFARGKIPLNTILSTILNKALRDSFLQTDRMARMLTVERNSIYTFKSELTLSRLDLVEEIQQDEKDAEKIIRRSARYPQPISDSLRTASDIENISKRDSGFPALAEMLENDIIKGSVSVGAHGEVLFTPLCAPETQLRMQISSSLVKTLSALDIYLRHIAAKGEYLIIDEPEMNLHPELQRLVGRLFARMVNAGIRLIISTHSDYILREINCLVMAHSLNEKASGATAASFGISKDLLLDPANIQPVVFRLNADGKSKAAAVPIDSYGFSIRSIDMTIDSQNEMAITLSDTLDSYSTEE